MKIWKTVTSCIREYYWINKLKKYTLKYTFYSWKSLKYAM